MALAGGGSDHRMTAEKERVREGLVESPHLEKPKIDSPHTLLRRSVGGGVEFGAESVEQLIESVVQYGEEQRFLRSEQPDHVRLTHAGGASYLVCGGSFVPAGTEHSVSGQQDFGAALIGTHASLRAVLNHA